MDEQTIKQVAEFQEQIAQLTAELKEREVAIRERDERIVALQGYLRLKHVDPDLLPV